MKDRDSVNERTKQELISIWTGTYAVMATLTVVIPLLIYVLNKYGFFDGFNAEAWADIKYIVTGPLFFFVGLAYAPVWITCAIYLVFLIFKTIFTIIIIFSRAAKYRTMETPKKLSRKDLINKMTNNDEEST